MRLGHEGDEEGEERLRAAVEVKMQATSDSDARRFGVAWTAIVAIFVVLYIAGAAFCRHANYIPVATGAVSLAFHFLAVLAHRCRGLPLRAQAWHTLTICADAVLIAVASPEVQYYLYGTSAAPLLELLGERPRCPALVVPLGGRCLMVYDASLNSTLLVVSCFFFVVFVLSFRQSVLAVVFVATSSTSIRFWVRLPYVPHHYDDMVLEFLFSAALQGLMLVAKRKIEHSQRDLNMQLARKDKEVVQEKVKRCEVEFQFEKMGISSQSDAPHKPGSTSGSAAASSGMVFLPIEAEDGEPLSGELQEMANIGRREHWLIDHRQLRLQPRCVLGSGAYGVVLTGTFVGSPVAVKFAKNCGADTGLVQLANELRILRHVRHPNIALFHGACFEPASETLAIILELVQGIDLDRYVRDGSGEGGDGGREVTDAARCALLLDVCRALNYLHTREPCIIHGDVKPANAVVEQLGEVPRVKLLDFGLSRALTPHARPLGGTLVWMAPEVLRAPTAQPTSAADAYSFGRVAFFVATGRTPHGDVTRRRFEASLLEKRLLPLAWPAERLPRRCQWMAERCMHVEPGRRPSLAEFHDDLVRWPGDLGIELPGRRAAADAEGIGWSEALAAMKQMAPADLQPPARPRLRPRRAHVSTVCPTAAAQGMLPTLSEKSERSDAGIMAALPGFIPTPRTTQQSMVCDTILKWHCEAGLGSCCAYHRALDELVDVCRELLAQECKPHLFRDVQERSMQCPRCLAISMHNEGSSSKLAGGDGCFSCVVCNHVEPEGGALLRRARDAAESLRPTLVMAL